MPATNTLACNADEHLDDQNKVKRNANDAGHVYAAYLERLAWLANETRGYRAADWRTNYYINGHFDKPFWYICSCVSWRVSCYALSQFWVNAYWMDG